MYTSVAQEDKDVEKGGGFSSQQKMMKNASAEIRSKFIVKVYSLLFGQLLLTSAIAALLMYLNTKMSLRIDIMMIVSSVFCFILLVFFACFPDLLRVSPGNFILLFIFTAFEGTLVGGICEKSKTNNVLIAFGITATIVLSLSVYACFTKRDFTGCGPYLFMISICLLIFGILNIFFRSRIMDLIYCSVGALLMSVYIIVDTQLILGRGKMQFTIDDYCLGAMCLYMDIIQLFLFILELMSGSDN